MEKQETAFKHCVFTLHTIWGFRMCYWIACEISKCGYGAAFFGPEKYLFHGQEEGDDCIDYLFGQEIINEASSDDKEYLHLNELWCLFAYREFYKNLLAILDEHSLLHLKKRQVSLTDFANTLVCMMMKEYTCIWWSYPTTLILILGSLMKQLWTVKVILSV